MQVKVLLWSREYVQSFREKALPTYQQLGLNFSLADGVYGAQLVSEGAVRWQRFPLLPGQGQHTRRWLCCVKPDQLLAGLQPIVHHDVAPSSCLTQLFLPPSATTLTCYQRCCCLASSAVLADDHAQLSV